MGSPHSVASLETWYPGLELRFDQYQNRDQLVRMLVVLDEVVIAEVTLPPRRPAP